MKASKFTESMRTTTLLPPGLAQPSKPPHKRISDFGWGLSEKQQKALAKADAQEFAEIFQGCADKTARADDVPP